MNIQTKIEFGWDVKDRITGFTGKVTGYCAYITGCNQVLVAPSVAKDGAARDAHWFDEQRLDRVGKMTLELDNGKTPGFDKLAPVR
ncbi:MAG: hypothetical protein P4M09_17055 [Devosia sp.]|nr:hypothetical protein [Devosia sp.]